MQVSHSFDLEGLPYLNSHGPGQLILHGEELKMILNNVIACLAKDLQNSIFLYTEIILLDGMYKPV